MDNNKITAIHTPTLGKKIMVQEALISIGWEWEDWGKRVVKDPETIKYPYVILVNTKRKLFTAYQESKVTMEIGRYNIISLEEFLSNI